MQISIASAHILLVLVSVSWSIQTQLEHDRDQDWELNQYYANPLTLQWESDWDQELTHIEITVQYTISSPVGSL